MKTKIFTALTALTLYFTICIPKVAAKSPCNWYCVHTTDHQRPKARLRAIAGPPIRMRSDTRLTPFSKA